MIQPSINQNTKTALVQAAQRLIAEKGLGTVSVKDITLAAGARNPSAVHYHFGNVETLIREVFAQRYREIEQDRVSRLATVDVAEPRRRLVALLEVAIAPFLETCLEQEGRLYVRFCLQVTSDPRFNLGDLLGDGGLGSLARLQQQFVDCLPQVPAAILQPRLRQIFSISLLQGADYARRIEDGSAAPLDEVVRESAVTLAAYLSAEPL